MLTKDVMMKLKYYLQIIVLALLVSCTNVQQETDYKPVHNKFSRALSLLQQSRDALASDSLLFNEEYDRVYEDYNAYADTIFTTSGEKAYAQFELERLMNMTFQADDIATLKQYHDSLFLLSHTYFNYIETDEKLADRIAQCVTNSYEIQGIGDDTELIELVKNTISNHVSLVYGDNASQENWKTVIDRYASQYASRGIISQAALLYKSFSSVYSSDFKQPIAINFSKDYTIYNKTNKPGNAFGDVESWKVIVFNQNKITFDMVHLIAIRRALYEARPNFDFIIARDSIKLGNDVIYGIGRNLSGDLNYITLCKQDIESFGKSPAFVVLMPNSNIAYSADNPIEMIDWIETPIVKQKAQKKLYKTELKKNRQLAIEKAHNNPDTTIKHKQKLGNINICLSGYWPDDVTFEEQYYQFTKKKNSADLSYPIISVNILNKGNLIYTNDFFNIGSSVIDLRATPDHEIHPSFSDSVNQQYYYLKSKLTNLVSRLNSYKYFCEEYVYSNSIFVENIDKLEKSCDEQIKLLLAESDNHEIKALLQASIKVEKLKQINPAIELNYVDFEKYMPTKNFQSIIYNSPFYEQLITAWLNYGINDPVTAVDLLFGSESWIPDSALSIVGGFVWKQMNRYSREDVMLHIDTLYLNGCSGNNNEVSKRLAGYKRMAIGKKAPNIQWYENGESKELYALKADSVYVVFWADWCEHCKNILPPLYENLLNKPNIKVICINLDEDDSSTKLGQKLMPKWYHLQAKEKWDSQWAESYNIFGTPTIYLLNKRMEIVSRVI